MALIKRKIKDSVSVSGGRPPPGSSGSRRNRGGGGGIRASIINKAQQEKDARDKAAHDQKAFRAAQIKKQTQTARAYNKQLKEAEVSRRKGRKDEGKISTGVFEKGGAVVQETRGDFASLERLNKQRPGSVLVQTKAGDYVLVEARGGINLNKTGTFDKFNENLKLEGRGLFYSIGEKNEQGGTDECSISEQASKGMVSRSG